MTARIVEGMKLECMLHALLVRVCYQFFFNSEVDGHIPKQQTVAVILPHELIHALSEHTFVFNSTMLGNMDAASRVRFWQHLQTLDPWKAHPGLDLPLDHLIPLTIFGDGAEFHADDECFVYSWASLFGSQGLIQDVLQIQYPVMAIPEWWMRSEAASRFNTLYRLALEPHAGKRPREQDSSEPLCLVVADLHDGEVA